MASGLPLFLSRKRDRVICLKNRPKRDYFDTFVDQKRLKETKREQKYPIGEIEFLSRKRKEVLNAPKNVQNLSQNGWLETAIAH